MGVSVGVSVGRGVSVGVGVMVAVGQTPPGHGVGESVGVGVSEGVGLSVVVGVVLGVTVGATPTDSEPPSSAGAGWASPLTSVKITSWSVRDVKPMVSPVKVTNANTPEPMGPAGSG